MSGSALSIVVCTVNAVEQMLHIGTSIGELDMKTYIEYKKWWIENIAPRHVPSLYYGNTVDQAFEAYVKGLGLYNLMETLADWEKTHG